MWPSDIDLTYIATFSQLSLHLIFRSHHLVCDATDRSRGFSLGAIYIPTLVLTVCKNTPADEAVLRCGDFILQVACYRRLLSP